MALSSANNAAVSGSVAPVSGVSQIGQRVNQILGVSDRNNAWSAQQAEELRAWQEQQNQKAMEFNASEAAKNRDWQKMMSDTAHQREVKDLLAAGLNPVLSVTGGNGAAVTSGATASGVTSSGAMGSTDMTANQAIVSLFGSLLAQQTQLAATNTNALANLAIADKYTAVSKYNAELQSMTQLSTANINAMATKYSAAVHADATKVSAAIHAAAQRYGADVSSMTQKEIAAFNADVNKELKQMDIDAKFDLNNQEFGLEAAMKQYYPSVGVLGDVPASVMGTVRDTLDLLTGSSMKNDIKSALDYFNRE